MLLGSCKNPACGARLNSNNLIGYCYACRRWAYNNDEAYRNMIRRSNKRWMQAKYHGDKVWRDRRNANRRRNYQESRTCA